MSGFGKKEKKPEQKGFAPVDSMIGKMLGRQVAKKDFKLVHNNYIRDIKEGDDLSDVPEMYKQNLKSENVL